MCKLSQCALSVCRLSCYTNTQCNKKANTKTNFNLDRSSFFLLLLLCRSSRVPRRNGGLSLLLFLRHLYPSIQQWLQLVSSIQVWFTEELARLLFIKSTKDPASQYSGNNSPTSAAVETLQNVLLMTTLLE